MKTLLRSAALVLLVAATSRADLSVVVPNAYATIPGTASQNGVLGTGNGAAITFQMGYAASQLSGLADGTLISGMSVRLPANLASVANDLNYSDYSIQIGQAARAIGSFSTTFADNMGSDTITARSGALTIPANSLIGGTPPNPFYTIGFATPYVYRGGDLLITLRYTTASTNMMTYVDAVDLPLAPGLVDTVANFGGAAEATGRAHYFTAPILGLKLGPSGVIPEPASIVLTGIGLASAAGIGLVRRRRPS